MSLTVGLICFGCRDKAEAMEDSEEREMLYEDDMFFFDDGISIELEEMLKWIDKHKTHGKNCIGFETVG